MSTTTKSIAPVLNSLIESCEDGQEGFRAAAEDGKSAAKMFSIATYRGALEHEELPSNVHYVIKRQYMGVQASQHRVRDLRIRLQSKQPECFRRAPGEEMPVVLLVARIMFYSAMEYATSLIVGNCKNLITLPTK